MDVELRLKQAIDQLLANKPDPVEPIQQLPVIKPVPGLDFDTVRFTDKVCLTNNQDQEIEFPNSVMMCQLIMKGSKDFWLSGVENGGSNPNCRFNFIGSNGKRTE